MPMPQHIFSQPKRRPRWGRRIVVLLVLVGAAYGAWKYVSIRGLALPSLSLPQATQATPPAPVAAPAPTDPATPAAPAPEAPAATPAAAPAPAPAGTPVEQAREKLRAGDKTGAKALLDPILAGTGDAALLPGALIVSADVATTNGDTTTASSLLDRVLKEFAGAPEAPLAQARYARVLETSGRAAEAEAIYTRLKDSAPKGYRAAALSGLGRKAEAAGDLVAARTLYRQGLNDAAPNAPEWDEALDHLGRLNVAMIFSSAELPESKFYTVEKGDSLNGIGVKLNTTQGLLIRANGLNDAARLHLGQRLKYTPKDFRIVVERSTCRIFLLDNEGIFKRYRTGLGMPGHETTLGSYTIGNKEKDPVWHPSGRPMVASGDPKNELGTRWMPLVPAAPNLPDDLGIHGTIAPETIGQYKSHGCPRMLKDDVEELYDLVVRSTPVQIVDTIAWNELLAPGAPAAKVAGAKGNPGNAKP